MTVFTGKCIAVLLETVIFYIFAMKCADTGNMDLRKKRMILLLLAVVHGVLMLPFSLCGGDHTVDGCHL